MIQELMNTDNLIGIGLIIALLLSLFMGTEQLSMNIATGLIGYIGRGKLQH